MDLRLLKTFLLVAQLQNITQAAEKLNFTQPTVTAQIQALEEILGVMLFERVGKKLRITEAGSDLVNYAERMLELYEEVHSAMAPYKIPRSTLTLGVSTHVINYFLPTILREYQNRIPNSAISIRLFMNVKDTVNGLLNEDFSLGMVHDRINQNQFCQFKIITEELVWVGAQELVKRYTYNQDIKAYPFINYTKGTFFRDKFEDLLKKLGLKSAIEYSDTQAVKQAVLDGLGVSMLPHILVRQQLADETLVQLHNAPKLELNVFVIFKRTAIYSPPISNFLTILSEVPQADPELKLLLSSKADL